ncbi:MAG: hypothetical protein ACLS3M_01595 [Collinsella sp.]
MKALSDLSDARMDELAGMRRKLAGTVDPDAPKAVLEPSLVPYYNPLFADRFSWALEFRIRCGSVSYVVKDIDGMAAAYVRGGTFSYGKKLTFLHTPEAFDEVSVRLLDLVVATVVYLSDITSSRSASYDFARSGFVAERQLPLSEHDIVYMLDLLRGRTISFEPAWSRGTTTHRSYEVAVELSPVGRTRPRQNSRRFAAKSRRRLCSDLRLPADMYCIASGDVAYLVDTRTAPPRRCGVCPACRTVSVASAALSHAGPYRRRAGGRILRRHCPCCANTLTYRSAVLDTVALEPSFAMANGVDDGLVTCKITVAYGDWSQTSLAWALRAAFEERRPRAAARRGGRVSRYGYGGPVFRLLRGRPGV